MADRVRVLVVEDERALAQVIAGYLRKEQFEVLLATMVRPWSRPPARTPRT